MAHAFREAIRTHPVASICVAFTVGLGAMYYGLMRYIGRDISDHYEGRK